MYDMRTETLSAVEYNRGVEIFRLYIGAIYDMRTEILSAMKNGVVLFIQSTTAGVSFTTYKVW